MLIFLCFQLHLKIAYISIFLLLHQLHLPLEVLELFLFLDDLGLDLRFLGLVFLDHEHDLLLEKKLVRLHFFEVCLDLLLERGNYLGLGGQPVCQSQLDILVLFTLNLEAQMILFLHEFELFENDTKLFLLGSELRLIELGFLRRLLRGFLAVLGAWVVGLDLMSPPLPPHPTLPIPPHRNLQLLLTNIQNPQQHRNLISQLLLPFLLLPSRVLRLLKRLNLHLQLINKPIVQIEFFLEIFLPLH